MDATSRPARLRHVGRAVTTPHWVLNPARTLAWPDYTLWIVDRGRGVVQTPVGAYPLEIGTCLLLPGGHAYTFTRDPEQGLEHFYLHFDYLDDAGRPMPPATSPAPPLYRRLDDYNFARGLIERTLPRHPAPLDQAEADRWLAALLGEVARQDRQPVYAGLEREQAQVIGEICRRIREQPQRRVRVRGLAAELGCTATHFARLFNKYVGQSPRQYVLDARMAAARHLLRDSTHSVGHIARLLGYRDVYFFSRQFRTHHGVTPTAFRRVGQVA